MAMRSYFEHHHPLARNHSPEKRPTSSVTERRGASEGSARICMHAYDMTWALSAQNEREPISIYACSRTRTLPILASYRHMCVEGCTKVFSARFSYPNFKLVGQCFYNQQILGARGNDFVQDCTEPRKSLGTWL